MLSLVSLCFLRSSFNGVSQCYLNHVWVIIETFNWEYSGNWKILEVSNLLWLVKQWIPYSEVLALPCFLLGHTLDSRESL
ncbi:hypothetical protein GIB67_038422 [Kingdonia uniflora]|uniref:Uncharacterized protein n=1 Tax=Kingdonia uniflora TaxID=39325 RepID=A0A7J7NP09_9MAGN|nr:hypothetical protein GIB67_038422 [Kingdonia uniflora]